MSTTADEIRPLDVRTAALRGGIAVAGSTLANAALLWAVLETQLVEPFMALSYPPVIFLTVAGAAGATVVYAVLTRRVADPDRTFQRVAAIVLALSFVPDLGILFFDEAATIGAVGVLLVMHAVVALVCVVALTRP